MQKEPRVWARSPWDGKMELVHWNPKYRVFRHEWDWMIPPEAMEPRP